MDTLKTETTEHLLQRIENRKKELQIKREQYEALMASSCRAVANEESSSLSTISGPSLIDRVVAEAMAAAEEAVAVSVDVKDKAEKEEDTKDDVKLQHASSKISRVTNFPYTQTMRLSPRSKTLSPAVDLCILPIMKNQYDKSCQSEFSLPPATMENGDVSTSFPKLSANGSPGREILAEEVLNLDASQRNMSQNIDAQTRLASTPREKKEIEFNLPEQQRNDLLSSRALAEFVDQASKMIECSLGQKELFSDYSRLRNTTDASQDKGNYAEVHLLQAYENRPWTHRRPVMDIRTHPELRDVFLAAYSRKSVSTMSDPEGCVLVWNIAMAETPESEFLCHSPVCCATYNSLDPNCIVGGIFSGAIVLWDTRAKKHPVQRTPLSPKSHRHPVYCIEVVGTQYVNNLVTLDNGGDGRVCLWSLSMLAEPTQTINLKPAHDAASFHCFSFGFQEMNSFITGTDNGSILSVQLHGTQPGVVSSFQNSHTSPVTSVHWHPGCDGGEGGGEYRDLALSASFDWTIKLWNSKEKEPLLHTFEEASESVLDVQWHPKHPGVFATCNADGTFYIWDITYALEVPRIIHSSPDGKRFLSLSWTKDGTMLITADMDGKICLWAVPSEVTRVKPDTTTALDGLLRELASQNTSTLALY